MSDHYQLENSSTPQEISEPYVSKHWVWTNDSNNGQYGSNQVDFDLSSIYNTQKLISPSEMYLQIPIVVMVSQDKAGGFGNAPGANPVANPGDTNNEFGLCFKSGFYNLINSFTIEYDGQQITQSTTNTNFYVSFKMNTTMSSNDLRTLSSTLGFYPDTSSSYNFCSAGENVNGLGNGISNNRNLPSANAPIGGPTTTYQGDGYNVGAFERCKHINFNPSAYTDLKTLQDYKNELKNFTQRTPVGIAGTANDCFYWNVTATIRLKDISSFFENMPLVQGFYSKIRFNMNLGSFAMTKLAGTNSYDMTASLSQMNFPYQTNPIMICAQNNNGNIGGFNCGALPTTIIVGLYIAKPGNSVPIAGAVNHSGIYSNAAHQLQSCRIYTPLIELQPERQLKYLQMNKNKAVLFEDLHYSFVSTAAANNIQYTINSINNPVGVLVIPMISSSVNGLNNTRAVTSFAPSLSPFASEPATTSPIGISNFNIQLSGVNVLNNNVFYNFELFNHEFYGVNAVNSGLSTGLNSGLIDQLGFENIYRYYYVNLERRLTDNITPKSITVTGVNNNAVACDYHIFVITRKQVNIDCSTGRIVSINVNA